MKPSIYKSILTVSACLIAGMASNLTAAIVFTETFESGNLNNWNIVSGASGLAASSTQNKTPNGAISAQVSSSLNRMYHNLGAEISGHSRFSLWIYDGSLFQAFGEVRGYVGSGYDPNTANLQQLLAIGKYTTTTMPGEVFDGTVYQARVFGPASLGWFNLNASGVPHRSPGWHKFEIERLADGTTINFYVDGILGRRITGATAATWDCVVIGSIGVNGTTGYSWIDDILIQDDSLSQPPVAGLVAHYLFNGNVQDASGNANHGIIHNTVFTSDRFGVANNAFSFNGINSYISIPHSPSLAVSSAYTLSAWIYQKDWKPSGYRIIDKETAGVPDGFILDTGQRLRVCDGTCIGDNLDHTLNQWHHVVATKNGQSVMFFVDGITTGGGSVSDGLAPNTLDLYIGAPHTGIGPLDQYFYGVIDDVRIYNRALSEAEVQNLYTADAPTVFHSPLQGWSPNQGGNGHYYQLVTTPQPMTWIAARDAATAKGGYLATITSDAENEFIFSLGSTERRWLGAYQPAGSPEPAGGWVWMTDEPFIYTHWEPGQPNEQGFGTEDKLHMEIGKSTWNDLNENDTGSVVRSYVIEYGTPGTIHHGEPIITVQPKSQFADAGSSVTFSVSAISESPLTYQWLHNGAAIGGATSSTFTISNAQQMDAGWYFAIVSNPFGSVRSQDASLAVADAPAQDSKPTYSILPPKNPTKNSLVVVTHGWQSQAGPNSWVVEMRDDISAYLSGAGNWQVLSYDWESDADKLAPWKTLGLAYSHGEYLGREIVEQGWSHVHLIGHSAGSALVQGAVTAIKSQTSVNISVHATFLDPYVGPGNGWRNSYGLGADWADNYFSRDASGSVTEGVLPYAFNVDVTGLDPNVTLISPVGASGFEDQPYSPGIPEGHAWPYHFYKRTITDIGYGSPYGFTRSKEAGGWALRDDYVRGQDPKMAANGSSPLPQGPRPLLDFRIDVQNSPHFASDTGDTELNGNGLTLLTGSPVWFAIGITVTNPINFVSFESQFTSPPEANGLLTICWDTNSIGFIDEKVTSPGLKKYLFGIPERCDSGNHLIYFRLDPFTNTLSSITITNISVGFSGIQSPIALGISKHSSSNATISLNAPAGFNYLIESSTNLLDWTPSMIFVNSNGMAQVNEATTSNLFKYYRAVSP